MQVPSFIIEKCLFWWTWILLVLPVLLNTSLGLLSTCVPASYSHSGFRNLQRQKLQTSSVVPCNNCVSWVVFVCVATFRSHKGPRGSGHSRIVVSDLSPVTPNVCLVDLCQKIIHPDCDIKFTGNVSWVGKTSMEVKMHMLQVGSCDLSPSYDRQ